MPKTELREITIKLRIASGDPTAYKPDHIDAHFDARQAEALQMLQRAIATEPIKLANGRWAQTAPDVVRAILEQVARAAAIPPPK